jgi:hypothetical protein
MTFQSVSDFVCKEQYLTVQLKSEKLQSSLENTDEINPSMIPFVIDIINSVIKKWVVYHWVYGRY